MVRSGQYNTVVTPYKIINMDALLKQLTPIVDLSPNDITNFHHTLKSISRYSRAQKLADECRNRTFCD